MRKHQTDGGWLVRDRAKDEDFFSSRFCSVAAAVIGSAVVGGVVSASAASKGAKANAASTQAAADAAAESEATARARLDFDKQAYADTAADRKLASDTARRAAAWQEEDRIKYNALQDDQIERGKIYQAAEDRNLLEAQSYDSEGRREREAGVATADVNQAFANARGQSVRNQQRMGINPNDGRSAAMENDLLARQALGIASAANTARKQVETQGYARKQDAFALGKGLVGNQATQAGLQLSAGNSAVSNSLVPLSVANSANATLSNAFGNASNSFNQSSSTFRNVAGLQSQNFYNAQQYGAGVGSNFSALLGNVYGGGAAVGNPFGASSAAQWT